MSESAAHIPAIVPVFPLPEVVLFPGQVLPLFIFEPRYRAMTADALAGDRQIAIALLRPGYECVYFTNAAPIHPVAGLGKILAAEELTDGKYNLVVRGVTRVRLTQEVPGACYRRARVEALATRHGGEGSCAAELRAALRRAVESQLCVSAELKCKLLRLFDEGVGLGTLVDHVAALSALAGEAKQGLLVEPDAVRRGVHLLALLRSGGAPPPDAGCTRWELN